MTDMILSAEERRQDVEHLPVFVYVEPGGRPPNGEMPQPGKKSVMAFAAVEGGQDPTRGCVDFTCGRTRRGTMGIAALDSPPKPAPPVARWRPSRQAAGTRQVFFERRSNDIRFVDARISPICASA